MRNNRLHERVRPLSARRRLSSLGVRLAGLSALLGSLIAAAPAADAAEPRPQADEVEAENRATLKEQTPQAFTLLEQGDAAYEARAFEKASALYADAVLRAPASGLLRRQQCRALTRLGKHDEAVASCKRGIEQGARSALDFRCMVGALVSGQKPPTPLELAQAHQYAELAIRLESGRPWGYAAMCEVARRTGDDALLATTLWQLEQVAPNHFETKSLQASLTSTRSPLGLLSGWLLLFAVTGATLLRALKQQRPTGRRSPSGLAA